MSGHDPLLRRKTDLGGKLVGAAKSAFEESCLAGGLVVMHAGLKQTAVVVKVVLPEDAAAVVAVALFGALQLGVGGQIAAAGS